MVQKNERFVYLDHLNFVQHVNSSLVFFFNMSDTVLTFCVHELTPSVPTATPTAKLWQRGSVALLSS